MREQHPSAAFRMLPNRGSNWHPLDLQDDAQLTEPHQPGQEDAFMLQSSPFSPWGWSFLDLLIMTWLFPNCFLSYEVRLGVSPIELSGKANV